MLETIWRIWQFVRDMYTILHTLYVYIVEGIRFVFRAVAATFVFLSNFPQELALVLMMCLIVGLCLFALGRN